MCVRIYSAELQGPVVILRRCKIILKVKRSLPITIWLEVCLTCRRYYWPFSSFTTYHTCSLSLSLLWSCLFTPAFSICTCMWFHIKMNVHFRYCWENKWSASDFTWSVAWLWRLISLTNCFDVQVCQSFCVTSDRTVKVIGQNKSTSNASIICYARIERSQS